MIGLIKNEYGWKRILEQEKVPWENINLNKNIKGYSFLILNSRDLDENKINKIKSYLSKGGAMLTDTLSFKQLDKHRKISKVYIKNISGKDVLFRNINSINIEKIGYKIKNSSIIYKSRFGKGFVIVLPFDLNLLMLDKRSKKSYLSSNHTLLKENLSLVSKGDLRRLIINCFHYLYFIRNLPYIHIWYYPKNYESVFSYRIDLDIFNQNEINNIIKIINKYKISFTWFLSVIDNKNHQDGIKNLHNLKQDLQSHSYEHLVYNSFDENYKNILESSNFISKIYKKPIGFAGPFGYWNKNLGIALEKLNYLYSSEFSLSYDDLPFYPYLEKSESKVLQLPIYPACIGLMIHRLYSKKQMKDYFDYLIEMRYKKQMPLFLYDHPNNGVGNYPDVLDYTLNKIENLDNVLITTMTDFAKFWRKREKIKFKIKNNKIITNNMFNDIYLRIVFPGYKEVRTPLKNQNININKLSMKQMPFFYDKKINKLKILKSKLTFSMFYLKI